MRDVAGHDPNDSVDDALLLQVVLHQNVKVLEVASVQRLGAELHSGLARVDVHDALLLPQVLLVLHSHSVEKSFIKFGEFGSDLMANLS